MKTSLRITAAILFAMFVSLCIDVDSAISAEPKKVVLVAGKPSHPPRMHEFNAGVQLLQECLKGMNLSRSKSC